ncbi:MAG: hypothetical protein IPK55_15355 [Streptococcus sp.]|nr:hypothetical protein [Streptococcus sp.]
MIIQIREVPYKVDEVMDPLIDEVTIEEDEHEKILNSKKAMRHKEALE